MMKGNEKETKRTFGKRVGASHSLFSHFCLVSFSLALTLGCANPVKSPSNVAKQDPEDSSEQAGPSLSDRTRKLSESTASYLIGGMTAQLDEATYSIDSKNSLVLEIGRAHV